MTVIKDPHVKLSVQPGFHLEKMFGGEVAVADTQRNAEGGAQSCEEAISPREARKFFYVFF